MPYGPTNFCLTVVKPYYTEEAPDDDEPHDDQPHDDQPNDTEPTAEPTTKNIELTARNE
jgi:hypothetical protein